MKKLGELKLSLANPHRILTKKEGVSPNHTFPFEKKKKNQTINVSINYNNKCFYYHSR
jgi:hypothetical protein